jgi:hypothetical protein
MGVMQPRPSSNRRGSLWAVSAALAFCLRVRYRESFCRADRMSATQFLTQPDRQRLDVKTASGIV